MAGSQALPFHPGLPARPSQDHCQDSDPGYQGFILNAWHAGREVRGARRVRTVETRYLTPVSKTSVEVDQDIVRQAAAILGTGTLRETIDAALREVVHAKRRLELIALLSEEGRFDFDAAKAGWGADG